MYAATFALKIFRMKMTLIVDFHFKIRQLNVINVFLNVFNNEKIYCHMSNEYKQLKKILKLLRALYEQRKSLLAWLRILIDKCIELELNSIFDEFCLFSNDNEILSSLLVKFASWGCRSTSSSSEELTSRAFRKRWSLKRWRCRVSSFSSEERVLLEHD